MNFLFLQKMDLGFLSAVLGDASTNSSLKSPLFDAELSQGILSQADTKKKKTKKKKHPLIHFQPSHSKGDSQKVSRLRAVYTSRQFI